MVSRHFVDQRLVAGVEHVVGEADHPPERIGRNIVDVAGLGFPGRAQARVAQLLGRPRRTRAELRQHGQRVANQPRVGKEVVGHERLGIEIAHPGALIPLDTIPHFVLHAQMQGARRECPDLREHLVVAAEAPDLLDRVTDMLQLEWSDDDFVLASAECRHLEVAETGGRGSKCLAVPQGEDVGEALGM